VVTTGYTKLALESSGFQSCDLSNCYLSSSSGPAPSNLKVYKISNHNQITTAFNFNIPASKDLIGPIESCNEKSNCVIAQGDFQKDQESLTFFITNNSFKSVRHIEFQNISKSSKIFYVIANPNMSCNRDFCLLWNILGIVQFSLITNKLTLVAYLKQKPSQYVFNNVSCVINSTKCIVVYNNFLSKGQKELSLTLVPYSETGFGKKSNFIIKTTFANNSNFNPAEVEFNCGVSVCGLVAATAVNSDFKPNTVQLSLLNSNEPNLVESSATINAGSSIITLGQASGNSISCLTSECYFEVGTINLQDSAGTQMIFKVGPKLFGDYTQGDVANYSFSSFGGYDTSYDQFTCDQSYCIFSGMNSFSIKLTTIKNI
jgi:hypothetical protein